MIKLTEIFFAALTSMFSPLPARTDNVDRR